MNARAQNLTATGNPPAGRAARWKNFSPVTHAAAARIYLPGAEATRSQTDGSTAGLRIKMIARPPGRATKTYLNFFVLKEPLYEGK